MFSKVWDKIPESFQIGIIIVLLFVIPTLLYYFTAHFEGVASILFLIAGFAFYKTSQKDLVLENYRFAIGFVILFAFLGMIFDSSGNFVYNKPIEKLCSVGDELVRDVVIVEGVSHDDPDVYANNFSCFSIAENKIVYEIPRWKTLGIRFLEYVLLAVFFVGFYWVLSKFRTKKKG